MAIKGAGLRACRDDVHDANFAPTKCCKRIGPEDRISALPDELLSDILVWLTVKEAIATSVLSKRWRHIWMSCPSLNFGCAEVFKHTSRDSYCELISKAIGLYRGQKLQNFQVDYPLRQGSSCHIDYWVAFAIARGVSKLELNFNSVCSAGGSYYYCFPDALFRSGKMMDSKQGISLLTSSLPSEKPFLSFRELCLRSVKLSDEMFGIILSSCLSLENFLLMDIYGLVYARNTIPHVKLKSFELYYGEELEKVELLAQNLLSFKYAGRRRNIWIKNSPQLINLRLATYTLRELHVNTSYPLGDDFIFHQFSPYLSKLESLEIAVHLFEDMSSFAKVPLFNNLKQLVLDVDVLASVPLAYYAAVFIMRAAPNLQKLELNIKLGNFRNNGTLELGSLPLHQNLKEVKLFGFVGDEYNMEFVTYILKHAVSLQKIEINLGFVIKYGGKPEIYDWTLNAGVAARCKESIEKLKQTLPSHVQLIFHGHCLLSAK